MVPTSNTAVSDTETTPKLKFSVQEMDSGRQIA